MDGAGVCYDKDATNCSDPGILQCRTSASCPIGTVCMPNVCDCADTTKGICVGTTGCGDEGLSVMGGLIRIGEMEKRRRTVRGVANQL